MCTAVIAAADRARPPIFIDHEPSGYAIAGEHPRLTEREILAEHGY